MYHLQNGPPPTLWTAMIHIIMLGLAIGSIIAAYRRSQQPPSAVDILIWFIGTTLLTLMAAAMVNGSPEYALSFIYGYITFIWVVAIFGCTLCVVRLSNRNKSLKSSTRNVITTLTLIFSLGLVVALLLPSVPQAREAARRTQCKNNLKQIGLAVRNYEEKHRQFPPAFAGEPPVSWRVSILPWLDQLSVYESYQLGENWNSAANELVAKQRISMYLCPSWRYAISDKDDRYYSAYGMLTGENTVGRGVKYSEVGNTSSTIYAFEACGLNLIWTKPVDIDLSTQPPGVNLPSPIPKQSPGWGSSLHLGGAHTLMVDGSVRFLSENISKQALKGLTTLDNADDPADF